MTPEENIEYMVKQAVDRLTISYTTIAASGRRAAAEAKRGDIKAVAAARLFLGMMTAGGTYDADLARIFEGFKNPDGSSRNTYDPEIVNVFQFIYPYETCGAPKNWRGGSGNP